MRRSLKITMRNWRLGTVTVGATVVFITLGSRDARACGGCFHPTGPTQSGTVVTDHRMIFAVSPGQTTLYDQIEYTGSPASFAWVLPVHGTVTVGLSSDLLFATLDSQTQTTIAAPPPPFCAPPPSCCCGCELAGGAASNGGTTAPHAGVTVTSQSVVGPYDTVQLHPNSTSDTAALTAWLTANSYAIPSEVQPIIAAYVTEGFDFLALRLAPGQGVQAMRPVSVTSTGAGLTLPLRMVAVGTGATVGITLWVVGTGRYEPQNFQNFTISASELVWDWSTSTSNYAALRTQKEGALNDAAWQIESSLNVSPLVIENPILQDSTAAAYTPAPGSDGGAGLTAVQARQADLATLFPGGGTSVRVTRMRADLSHAALANDLVLQASANQAVLSNDYQITQSVNAPPCPVYPPVSCPPCGAGGSGSGGPGTFGGGGATADGGAASAPGHESFGCAASAAQPAGGKVGLLLGGLFAVGLLRARARRKR